jgi:hypothetical protein
MAQYSEFQFTKNFSKEYKNLNQIAIFSLACMKNCNAYNLTFFISDDNIVVSKFTIISMAWLFKIQIQNICLLIIARPYPFKRYMQKMEEYFRLSVLGMLKKEGLISEDLIRNLLG